MCDDDFESSSPENLTGFKILKEIKKHNKGIQVIIFSASNKLWNLKALQEAGADGFILKESPENAIDINFTFNSIKNIYDTIDNCIEYSFLIDWYDEYKGIESKMKEKIKSNELPKDFVNEYLKWLEFGINNISVYKNNEGKTTSFLMFFSVLENLCTRIVDIDNFEKKCINEYESNPDKKEYRYKFKFRHNNSYLTKFLINDDYYTNSNTILESRNSRLNWGDKILNTLKFLSEDDFEKNLKGINQLINKRNDIIHSNVTTGDKIEISDVDISDLFNLITNIKKIK